MNNKRNVFLSTVAILASVVACGGSQLVEFPIDCDCPVGVSPGGGGQGGSEPTAGSGNVANVGNNGGTGAVAGNEPVAGSGNVGNGGTGAVAGSEPVAGSGNVGNDSNGGSGAEAGKGEGGSGAVSGGAGKGGSGGSGAASGSGGKPSGDAGCGGAPNTCETEKVKCDDSCETTCKTSHGHKHYNSCGVYQHCVTVCKAACECTYDECKKPVQPKHK